MNVEDIRKLVVLMEEAGLTELEIEDRSGKVRLVRGSAPRRRGESSGAGRVREPADRGEADARAIADTPDEPGVGRVDEVVRLAPGMVPITSPMVGTFYRAPAPDAPPFVAPGDVVQPGQVVCVIEAMKMMNEIHAEAAARIVSVQAENGAAVEYGSPLFLIELLE